MLDQRIPGHRRRAASPRDLLIDGLYCRWVIEVPAAGLAAQRATPADLHLLKTTMRAPLDDAESAAYDDVRFHYAVAVASNNCVLAGLIHQLLASIPPDVHARLQALADEDDHERIVRAIERGSRVEARRAMSRHLGPIRGAAAEIEASWHE
jgi:GntR family transcriptional regulator, transcriptional repressor for pyruvate dehydrogenase complex